MPLLPVCVRRIAGAVGLLVIALSLGGCAEFFSGRQTHRSSSVVSYLYPGKEYPRPATSIPVLRLPLRVGVAFVPSAQSGGFAELQKNTLLQRVADEFKSREYIGSIEIIPSTYLRVEGGFTNLRQVRNLLNVDVVALVAYDQVQFTDENILSLSYWTIVGAYIFKGNKNDSQTLMEAAVYDIASEHLLFRAAGSGQVKGNTTAMSASENLRADGTRSLDLATTDLIANLKVQLEQFREKARQSPETVKIERTPGYTGGGSIGATFAGAMLLLMLTGFARRKA